MDTDRELCDLAATLSADAILAALLVRVLFPNSAHLASSNTCTPIWFLVVTHEGLHGCSQGLCERLHYV